MGHPGTTRTSFDDVVIPGDGLDLRPLTDADIDPVLRACQDAELQRWLPVPLPYTRAVAEGFVRGFAPAAMESGRGVVRAISVGGELQGVIDFKGANWSAQEAEIGYWVAPWARGAGLAGRASRALADWGLGTQDLQRVVIKAATGNIASQKAALAAGFEREGVARNAGFVHGGRVDLVVFGKVVSDLGRPPVG